MSEEISNDYPITNNIKADLLDNNKTTDTLNNNRNDGIHDALHLAAEHVTNHLESKVFYEANDTGDEICFKTDSPKFLRKDTSSNYSIVQAKNNVIEIEDEDESPYEVLHKEPSVLSERNERVSISKFRRRRPKGDSTQSMYVVGDSMIGFKDGVPGTFSPIKVASSRKNVKSAPVLPDMNFGPLRPPRKNRGRINTVSQARIYDKVFEEEETEMRKSSESSSSGSYESDHPHHVMISTGNDGLGVTETGVRIIDPNSNTPRRTSATVVLPMSLNNELSESGEESWGSDFEESFREEVTEDDVYEVLGKPNEGVGKINDNNYERIDCIGIEPKVRKPEPLPPLPPRHNDIFIGLHDPEKETYVEVNIEDEIIFPTQLPSLDENADETQLKRYQLVKCIVENEKLYMKSLNRLIKEYEEPLKRRNIISQDRIKIIFRHVHEIIQCHQLFNMALADRTKEWTSHDAIGDVINASFSKSIVLKAYSSFVHNFSVAMESIKETCKLVPAFLNFLKNHINRHSTKQSLYDLMRQPLERIPQLVTLTQELTKITPLLHADHFPLQMALTQLECLSDILSEKKRDSMFKHKVRQLDNYCIGLEKPLSSKNRYYVRHDDMLQCVVEEGKILKTKLRRLFMLNDLLICAGVLTKPKKLKSLTSKKFKIKWCVPINDVQILDVGSGISFQSDRKTLTTKYSHLSSPRPGGGDSPKVLEDLQHDIEVIGEIVGKVSSLRRSYRFVDMRKVNQWYNDVKAFYERERELVNMHWIEVSIPSSCPQSENIRYLFNVHSADKRMEWLAEFDNVKLRLTHNNNPGWYLQEDNTYDGEAAVLRRTLPLIANKLPLFVGENKHKVECSLEVSISRSLKPILWLFSGGDHVGMITLMEMNMSSVPHVIESFVACDARICVAERVPEEGYHSTVPFIPNVSVWVGTMSGRILVFDPNMDERYPVLTITLKDAVISLKYSRSRVFAGLANGTVACFRRKVDGTWDMRNPTIIILDKISVLSITEAAGYLWCACSSTIHIINSVTLAIEKRLTLEERDEKQVIKHLVVYGLGVWVSMWRSSKLQLYHAETLNQLQIINVSTAISRMKNDIDINVDKINSEKLYITSVLARNGLLWVGTDQGLVLTYPLPKLGGIPKVNGSACISFHGHEGPVRHLYAFKVNKSIAQRSLEDEKPNDRSFFYADAYEEELGQSLEVDEFVENTEEDQTEQAPHYFEVEPDDVKADKRKLFSDGGGDGLEENENSEAEEEPFTELIQADKEKQDDNADNMQVLSGEVGTDHHDDPSNEPGNIEENLESEDKNKETGDVVNCNEDKKSGELKSNENDGEEDANDEVDNISVEANDQDEVISCEMGDVTSEPAIKDTANNMNVSLNAGPLQSSTPNRECVEENKDLQDDRNLLTIINDSSNLPRSASGYELAVENDNEDGSKAVDSTASSTDLQKTWSVLCDHYKTMPLPDSPWHNFQEGLETPPLLDKENYTPLLEDERRDQSFTSSISSGIGFKAYEKEISFTASNPQKADSEGNYTSLTPHSKREAAARREVLLKPCYVISIGIGHIDFRRPSKRGSKTAEFFRALSAGGTASNQPESMLLAWKLN